MKISLHMLTYAFGNLINVLQQWVETNQSNFHTNPMDIHLLPPRGTMLTAFADVKYRCLRI
jgi:hypothetical protein